jgi:hypothetical protein
LFEGITEIRRIRFFGDSLALGLIDGRCSVINLKNGDVINKFNGHKGEITRLIMIILV